MDVKSIIKLIPGFKPTPKSGTVSTIQKSASAFVKRRKQLGGAKSVMPVKKAMGGQAGSARDRAKSEQTRRTKSRKELMDMLDRLYGKDKPTPKQKPKNPKTKREEEKKFMERPFLPKGKPKPKAIRPFLPKGFKKPKAERAK